MSKLDDIVESDDCIKQALALTSKPNHDQLVALAQVNATKAIAEEQRTANLIAYLSLVHAQQASGIYLNGPARARATEAEYAVRDRLGLK